VGGGFFNRARGNYSVVAGGGGDLAADSNSALGNRSVIGGGYRNTASGEESTIAGGSNNSATIWDATVGGGSSNSAAGTSATVSGGGSNLAAGNYSVVAGGIVNRARGTSAVVSGGGGPTAADSNSAKGDYSVVPGGRSNYAAGDYSFAGGRRAKATAMGSFAWADSYDGDFTVPTTNRFAARAGGGVYFYTNPSLTQGSYIPAGSSGWNNVSDSTKKRNIRLIDAKDILNKVANLPIKQWSYQAQDPGIEHIGPMAQDFWKQFHVGDDSLSISTIDPDGIALAAIQALNTKTEALEKQNAGLRKELDELKSQVKALVSEKNAGRAGK
jgi:trimeric autotransporter adhesin